MASSSTVSIRIMLGYRITRTHDISKEDLEKMLVLLIECEAELGPMDKEALDAATLRELVLDNYAQMGRALSAKRIYSETQSICVQSPSS